MTSPEYDGKLMIVFAGYERPMDELLAADPGLSRRFTGRVFFEDIAPLAAAAALPRLLAADGFSIAREVDEAALGDVFRDPRARNPAAWGNLGDVKTFGKKLFAAASRRLMAAATTTPAASAAAPTSPEGGAGAGVGGTATAADLGAVQGAAATPTPRSPSPVGGRAAGAGVGAVRWDRVYTPEDVRAAAAAFFSERSPAAVSPAFAGMAAAQAALSAAYAADDACLFDTGGSHGHHHHMNAATATARRAKPNEPAGAGAGASAARKPAAAAAFAAKSQKHSAVAPGALMDAFNAAVQGLGLATRPDVVRAILAAGPPHPRYAEVAAAMAQQAGVQAEYPGPDAAARAVAEQLAAVQEAAVASDALQAAAAAAEAAMGELQARSTELLASVAGAAMAADRERAEEERRRVEAELERKRAEAEAAARRRREICGICGRANTPYSGCGYGGNSPLVLWLEEAA
jgi:hypothetical protein